MLCVEHTHTHIKCHCVYTQYTVVYHLYSEFEIENDSNNSDQIECDMGAHSTIYITIECDVVSSHLEEEEN